MALPIFNFNAPRRLPQQPNPNAVRAYIREILITRLDTTPSFADEVAEKWPVRRTYHLYTASRQRFDEIFGAEIGPVLHSVVHEDISADWWNSYEALLKSACFAISICLAVYFFVRSCRAPTSRGACNSLLCFFVAAGPLLLVSILVWPNGPRDLSFLLFFSVFSMIPGTILGIILWIDLLVEKQDKEKAVEQRQEKKNT